MNQLNNRQKIAIAAAVVLLLIVAIFVLLGGGPSATVTITTDDGVEIFTAEEAGGELVPVGTGTATVEVAVPSRLLVQAVAGNRIVQGGVIVREEGSQELNLPLSKQNFPYQELYQGAVSDLYIADRAATGIEPSSRSITHFGTEEFVPPRPAFVGIPFLDKITWGDEDNFNFLAFRGGVYIFKDGKLLNNDQFGKRVVGQSDDGIARSGTELAIGVEDIDKVEDGPTYFLGEENIYRSTNLGQTLTSITGYQPEGDFQSIATTGESVFRLSAPQPASYADETGLEDGSEPLTIATLTRYTSAGEQNLQLKVDGNQLVGAAKTDSTECALTDRQLVCIASGTTTITPLYTELNADIISRGGQIYVLADSGLWRVAEDGGSLATVVNFKGIGSGLARSLSEYNGQLIFGTRAAEEGTAAATYRVSGL